MNKDDPAFRYWFIFGEHLDGRVDINDGDRDILTVTRKAAHEIISARDTMLDAIERALVPLRSSTVCTGTPDTLDFSWCPFMTREILAGNVELAGWVHWKDGTVVLGRAVARDTAVIYKCPGCAAVLRTRPISFDWVPD